MSRTVRHPAASVLGLTALAMAVLWGPWREPTRKTPGDQQEIGRVWGHLTPYFVENRGQLSPDVAFEIEGAREIIRFRAQGLTHLLRPDLASQSRFSVSLASSTGNTANRIDLEFVDASPDVWPTGRKRTDASFHFYLGPRDQWRENVPSYREIVYRDLWPRIDLIYAASPGQLKATFVAHPGADPDHIQLSYRGAEVSLLENGRLKIKAPAGSFEDAAPMAYQRTAAGTSEVPVSYELTGTTAATRYRFRLGPYDGGKPLFIDPSIVLYAGYLGGFRDDEGRGIALDAERAAYIVGTTNSLRPAPPGGGSPPSDAFVIKINAAGTEVAYAVRIGGDEEDRGADIAVDDEGNAYVTGSTSSSEASFPLRDGLDMTFGGGFRDAYVLKLHPSGLLAYSSYLGGSEADDGLGIAVDAERAAYVSGETRSTETDGFPLAVGPDLTHNGGSDAFITKLNPAGDAVLFSGYLGGDSRETGIDVAVDRWGNAYLTGEVFSGEQTFPVVAGPGLTFSAGLRDAYVAKVRADGSGFDYAGYIGGASDDFATGIAVDSAGHAYVTGTTFSTEDTFPVKVGPNLILVAFNDAFVAKVSPTGVDLIFAGYIGGFGTDNARGIAIDKHRDVYVTGRTLSGETGFPVLIGPDLSYNGGGSDGFLAKVRSDGTGLIQAGYIGGFDMDEGAAIAVDQQGNAYVTVTTSSTGLRGFPVTAQPAPQSLGGSDAFVAKISTEMPDRAFEVTENGVLNAATLVQFPDPLHPAAPGSIVSVFGRFACVTESAGTIPLPLELGGLAVTFDGVAAPLFAVIRGDDFNPPLGFDQVNAQMPWGIDAARIAR